jgi:hypothetical protein
MSKTTGSMSSTLDVDTMLPSFRFSGRLRMDQRFQMFRYDYLRSVHPQFKSHSALSGGLMIMPCSEIYVAMMDRPK